MPCLVDVQRHPRCTCPLPPIIDNRDYYLKYRCAVILKPHRHGRKRHIRCIAVRYVAYFNVERGMGRDDKPEGKRAFEGRRFAG